MLSINEINLLQSQNEGLKKQNKELQEENKHLKDLLEEKQKEPLYRVGLLDAPESRCEYAVPMTDEEGYYTTCKCRKGWNECDKNCKG